MKNGSSVLVIDDDADVREALGVALSDEGYTVAEAGDGNEALDWLRSHPEPGAILLDWNMSPMNGSSFMAEVRKSAALAKIPVIVITADICADRRAADGRHWLVKPFPLEALFALLRSPAPAR
jgi:CheY-like chemotaxis protein